MNYWWDGLGRIFSVPYLWNFWDLFQEELQGISNTIDYIFKEGNQTTDFFVRCGEGGRTTTYLDSSNLPKEVWYDPYGPAWFT